MDFEIDKYLEPIIEKMLNAKSERCEEYNGNCKECSARMIDTEEDICRYDVGLSQLWEEE